MIIREGSHQDARTGFIADPADVFVYLGFVGRSQRPGYCRLYLNPEWSDFLEFQSGDVLFARTLDPADYPLGGTFVWLRRDASVLRTRTTSREAQADFLTGDLVRGLLARPTHSVLNPALQSIPQWLVAGGCLTGGDFHTYCSACSAVPTALVLRKAWQALQAGLNYPRTGKETI
jgi:hypothetical protein